jgi:ferric-chelate reductase [NAD(P)H]
MTETLDANAVRVISYGMYIVTSNDGPKLNGQIANTVFQTTAEPQQIAVCINHQNLTHDYIAKSGAFGVSVLDTSADMEFIGLFGFRTGRKEDKLSQVKYKLGSTGVPLVLDHALAVMEAKVVGQMDIGSHTMFVGRIVSSETVKAGQPMTYDYYHKELRGLAPKTAPTYVAPAGKT